MAVVAEELISDLIVRDGKLRSGIRSAQQAYGSGVGAMRNDTKRFESEFNRSAGNISASFKQLAGTLAAGVSLSATVNLIDGYTKLQNQLRVAGLEGEKLIEVQERLRAIGSEYGADLGALAAVYGKVTIAGKELGATSEQILTVNEAVAAALKVSGSSAEQAQGALLQFSQAMSSGTVRAEELNSIMEGAFPLAQAAARGIDRFGGSVAKLRAAVLEGEVSSREFFNGVIAGAPALLDQAAKANLTLAQSFTALKNELMLYVGGAASANGVAGALSAGIKDLADNLDRIIPILAVVGAALTTKLVVGSAAVLGATEATKAILGYGRGIAAARDILIATTAAEATAATTAAASAAEQQASAAARLVALRAEQEALKVTIAQERALMTERRAQALFAVNSNLQGVALTKARAEQVKAANDASFAEQRLNAARQQQVAIGLEVTAAERALAASRVQSTAAAAAATTATTAAAAANSRAAAASTALAVAGRGVSAVWGGILSLFGGPVGAAIFALGAGLTYLAYESSRAEAAAEALQQQYANSATKLDEMVVKLQAAGVSTEDLARISDVAAGRVDKLADSYNRASVEAHKMATAISMATIEMLKQAAVASAAAKADRLDAERQLTQASGADAYNRTGMRDRYLRPAGGTVIQDLQKRIADARAEERRQDAIQEAALIAYDRGVDLGPTPGPPGAAAADKPKKTPKGRSGPDLAEQAAQRAYREEQELRSLRLEEIRAKEQLAATTEERADLQRDALDLERQSREAEIAEGIRRKDLTLDQAQAQLEIVNSLYGMAAVLDEQGQIVSTATQSLYGAAIAADAARKAEEERASLSQTQADIQRDELQFAYDMADTNSERRDIALQMIELDAREQRAKLEGIIAVEKIGSLRRREAEALLAALDGRTANARDRATRDTENPLERLSRESNLTADQMNEAFQSIQADGLTALSDGITDVIMQTRSLGDVFKSVANQIIADLIRIAVQKAVVGALGNALGGLFGGSNPLGSGGGMDLRGFRAGGGPVRAGQLYRVNEGQQEFFRPATDGRVVPLSQQAQAARPAGGASAGPTIVQLAVAPGEMFVPIVEGISGNVSVRTVQAAAPGLVRAATIETTRRAGRPRT